jgi:hypothetical protein
MPKVNQLTVLCTNRPGTLAHIAKVMGDAGVNILGFLLTTSGSKGRIKLVVDDAEKAKEALESADLTYAEEAVLHARLPNVPGALGRLSKPILPLTASRTFGDRPNGVRPAATSLQRLNEK